MKTIYTCLAAILLTFNLNAQVAGCTDASAPNFNPDATEDDGSCCYANYVNLDFSNAIFTFLDINWELLDEGGVAVASGGVPGSLELCLGNGCYQLVITDENGLEWNFLSLLVTDEDGNALIDYEWTLGGDFGGEYSFCLSEDCPIEDFDCNFVINISDLFAVLADFGCDTGDCTCDLNGDGATNTADIILFLSALFD